MKYTFIRLQFAPKGQTNGGKVQTSNEPQKESDTQTDTLQGNDTQTDTLQPQTDELDTQTNEIDELDEFNDSTSNNEANYESENLTVIRNEIARLETFLPRLANDSGKLRVLMAKIFTQQELEKVEIKAIKANLLRLEIEEKRNAIVALNDSQITLYLAMMEANNALDSLPAMPDEERNKTIEFEAANLAYKAYHDVRENVVNRLLGGMPSLTKVASNGQTQQGGKGDKAKQIIDIIAPLYASKTPSEIRSIVIKEHGFNDGTANAVIHRYECENSLNGKTPSLLVK